MDNATVSRFEASIREDEFGCWIWTASLNPGGYGRFCANGLDLRAHRWSYEYHRAEIPEGLVIDHLCRNRACVNPWHLEPVTDAVNVGRGLLGGLTHCKRGHEFTPENTGTQHSGARFCRACRRAGQPSRTRITAECANGHPMSGDNLVVTAKGNRMCRECKRAAARASHAARWGSVSV